MITLTAEIEIKSENHYPFRIGVTPLGGGLIGEKIEFDAVFDKRNLISVEGEIKDRSDIKKPSWGIFSNIGSLSFNDKNRRFLGYANYGVLKEGIPVKLFLKNTLSKQKRQVGSYYTKEWAYDNDNLSCSVKLQDDLEEWQDINIDGIDYDPRKPESKSMSYFYDYLWSKTPSKFKMLHFSELDEETRNHLNGIDIKYPLLESGNLWAQWTKLCESSGCYIYKNHIGKTICKYSKGS